MAAYYYPFSRRDEVDDVPPEPRRGSKSLEDDWMTSCVGMTLCFLMFFLLLLSLSYVLAWDGNGRRWEGGHRDGLRMSPPCGRGCLE